MTAHDARFVTGVACAGKMMLIAPLTAVETAEGWSQQCEEQ